MYKIIIAFIALCFSIHTAKATDCDIPLMPLVSQSSMGYNSPEVTDYIEKRLTSLISTSGSIGAWDATQFALVFAYDIIDKQIVNGSPTKIIYNISSTYKIVDLKSKNVYGSLSQSMKGIGNNEQKALLNTFQKININNNQIKEFIQQGQNKILEFYNNNYISIIKEAQALAATRKFDNAIYNLMMIPHCCVGYEEALSVMQNVFQQFVNQHCNENLAQARAVWISSPDKDGAVSASVFLSEIYPDAACYEEALELSREIKNRMGDEWKFAMKQWNDNISLEGQRIEAMREIGMAFARVQNSYDVNKNQNNEVKNK